MNLFEMSKKYHLAHCISSDCKMGAGIAVDFQKKFHLRNRLIIHTKEQREHPTCIRIHRVFNLITKKDYYGKPTYNSIKGALIKMRDMAIECNINKIAMPKIGSGLDKLSWPKVREIIQEVFKDTNIEIIVCYI